MSEEMHQDNPSARELVAFRIGTQEYCVNIMSVREIRGWTPATALPRAPEYVRGVINLRGSVLPIIDLADRLGLERSQASDRHVIIICQIRKHVAGLLVDAVSDILTITEDAVQPTPEVASETAAEFIQGVIALDGRMISLINLDRVLPSDHQEAA